MCHILKVQYSCIIVVLSGKDNFLQVTRMNVRDGVLMSIPSSETKIETSHESYLTVNEAQLFMMGPKENGVPLGTVNALERISG
jgi:hypothetical protein